MAYCSACGHLNSGAARFCRSCGAPQDVQESQPNTAANHPSNAAPEDAVVLQEPMQVVPTPSTEDAVTDDRSSTVAEGSSCESTREPALGQIPPVKKSHTLRNICMILGGVLVLGLVWVLIYNYIDSNRIVAIPRPSLEVIDCTQGYQPNNSVRRRQQYLGEVVGAARAYALEPDLTPAIRGNNSEYFVVISAPGHEEELRKDADTFSPGVWEDLCEMGFVEHQWLTRDTNGNEKLIANLVTAPPCKCHASIGSTSVATLHIPPPSFESLDCGSSALAVDNSPEARRKLAHMLQEGTQKVSPGRLEFTRGEKNEYLVHMWTPENEEDLRNEAFDSSTNEKAQAIWWESLCEMGFGEEQWLTRDTNGNEKVIANLVTAPPCRCSNVPKRSLNDDLVKDFVGNAKNCHDSDFKLTKFTTSTRTRQEFIAKMQRFPFDELGPNTQTRIVYSMGGEDGEYLLVSVVPRSEQDEMLFRQLAATSWGSQDDKDDKSSKMARINFCLAGFAEIQFWMPDAAGNSQLIQKYVTDPNEAALDAIRNQELKDKLGVE
jgi:hypothetical protein